MTQTTLSDDALRDLLRQALADALEDRRDLLREVLAEVLEDAALGEAIRAGLATEPAPRTDVFEALGGPA